MGTLSLEHLQPMVCLAFGAACSTKQEEESPKHHYRYHCHYHRHCPPYVDQDLLSAANLARPSHPAAVP